MASITGLLYWMGELPDDDDVENAPYPVFSGDFGEQWQYMATEPVITNICNALRHEETVSELLAPVPQIYGWYTYFVVADMQCSLCVHWAPYECEDDEKDDDYCFAFHVGLCASWYYRLLRRSQCAEHFRALGAVIARAFDSASEVEGVVFDRLR